VFRLISLTHGTAHSTIHWALFYRLHKSRLIAFVMAVSCSWSLSCCWWWCWCCGWLPHQHLNWGQQSFSLDSVCVPLWSRGPFKSMFVICISHAFELTALAAHILLLIIAIGQPATAATLLLQQQQQHHCRSSRSSSGSSNASAFWPYPIHWPNIEFRLVSSSMPIPRIPMLQTPIHAPCHAPSSIPPVEWQLPL